MKALRLLALSAALLAVSALQGQAAMLVGVTGDGAGTPESLFYLDQTNASSTFIMSLGAGNDGETIAYNLVDGLLYHASGLGGEVWESVDLDTATVASSTPLVGYFEALGMVYNPSTGRFLVSDLTSGFFDVTPAGVVTGLGATDESLKGLAFVGETLYGAAVRSDTLYTLDAADGSTLSSVTVTLDGNAIVGMSGLATNPDTGELWAIFRQGSTRTLGTLNPLTGAGASVGVLSDNFAGIAFVGAQSAVPEPSSLVLLGMGAVGLGLRTVRGRRRTVGRHPSTRR